jgi:hypothetical protein
LTGFDGPTLDRIATLGLELPYAHTIDISEIAKQAVITALSVAHVTCDRSKVQASYNYESDTIDVTMPKNYFSQLKTQAKFLLASRTLG